jgi:hypothetical protein
MFATSRLFAFSAIAGSALFGIALGPRVAADRDLVRGAAECCCCGIVDAPCTIFCCCGGFCVASECVHVDQDQECVVLQRNFWCSAKNCTGHPNLVLPSSSCD